MDDIKSKAIHGVIWSTVERFSGQIIQFAISIILARLLIPSDYGIIGLLSLFMAIAGVFIDGGFSTALIQKKDRNEEDLSTVFYINMVMSIICYTIIFFCAPLISQFFNQPILTNIARVYCVTLIIGSLSAVNSTQLTIKIDYKTRSKISIASAITSGLSGIILAYFGFGVWALVCQAVINSILTTILTFYYTSWFPSLVFSKKSFKKLFNFGSKLLISSIIAATYANIYNVVIGKQFKPAVLGYFSRAQGFTNLTSNNINAIISRVSFPILTQIQDDDQRLRGIYEKYIQMSSFVTFPLVLLLCGIAKPLVLTLLSETWSDTIIILQIISFAYLWEGLNDINLSLIKAKGRSDYILKLEVTKKSIAFLILFISILFKNIYAICIGCVVYDMIAVVLNTHYTNKILKFGYIKQFKVFIPYLIISVISMIAALGISAWIDNPPVALTLSLIFCPILYLFICRLSRLYAYNEFVSIIKKIKSR